MEIRIRDNNLVKIDVVDVVNSFLWTDRYSKAGDFEIFTKASSKNIQSFKEDYFLQIAESNKVMIVESINLTTDIEDGNKFIAKGRSLESILERRIIWKQTTLSGGLQQGIEKLLNENAINPEDPDRKISKLIFQESTDPLITSLSANYQFTGDNLYDTIQILCEINNIGFRITLSPERMFVFELYSGVNRTFDQLDVPAVSFSPKLDNLSNTSYFHSKRSHKSITLVGGEGEGSDRVMAQVMLPSGAGTELDRREKFTDARDLSSMVDGVQISSEEYNNLLTQRGYLSLLESQQVSYFDGIVDSTVNYTYGKDFFLGDVVQIENEYGLQGKSRVTEIIFSEDPSGRNSFPTFETVE